MHSLLHFLCPLIGGFNNEILDLSILPHKHREEVILADHDQIESIACHNARCGPLLEVLHQLVFAEEALSDLEILDIIQNVVVILWQQKLDFPLPDNIEIGGAVSSSPYKLSLLVRSEIRGGPELHHKLLAALVHRLIDQPAARKLAFKPLI